jgi:hypothetical protein
MTTIQMTIDERLLKVVNKMTRARKTTRSAFIREDEIRHAEGYTRKPVASREFDIWLSEQDWDTSKGVAAREAKIAVA